MPIEHSDGGLSYLGGDINPSTTYEIGHLIARVSQFRGGRSPGGGDTANNGNGYLFYPYCPVYTIYRSYEAGGITGSQFEEVFPYTLFIVGITMEENIGYLILLATLKYCLFAIAEAFL
ncbi:unnamed protein product, partial [marine sediment metagenome]